MIRLASDKKKIIMSKSDWLAIGKKAGWLPKIAADEEIGAFRNEKMGGDLPEMSDEDWEKLDKANQESLKMEPVTNKKNKKSTKTAESDWPESGELKKGRFTEYCKKQGFDGPCKACADKAMESDDESVRGMASFYLNTVKP